MYYSSFGMLSIVIHCIINYEILIKPRIADSAEMRVKYRQFLYSVLVYYVSDVLWGALYELRIIPLAYADTFIYFTTMVVSVLLWTRFIIEYLNVKSAFSIILYYAGWIIFFYEMITLIVNFFVPIVFSFEAGSGDYRPGQARYVTLAFQAALFFITSIYTLQIASKSEGKHRLHHMAVGLSGLAMTIFIVLQTLNPLLPYYAIGCLLATCVIHSFVVGDEMERYDRELGSAKLLAYTDPLTGVKNKHAYIEMKKSINRRIKDGTLTELAIVVFDINDLKTINDTRGHDEGDRLIKDACSLICKYFKSSPVYRIGGDEFVVLLEGDDFSDRIDIHGSFESIMEGKVYGATAVVASGMDDFLPGTDKSFEEVFERADYKMYKRKKELKEKHKS